MSDLVVTIPVWLLQALKWGAPLVVILVLFILESRDRASSYINAPVFTIAALGVAAGYYVGLLIG